MKLRNLLITLFLVVSLGNSIVGGLLYYFSDSIIAKNIASQNLLAIAESRAENIKTYFNDGIDKLKLVSSRIQLKIDVENYFKAPGPELKEVIRVKLSDSKNAVAEYRHVCLIGLDGKVATCDDPSLNGQDFSKKDFFVKGKLKEGVYIFNHTSLSHLDIVTAGPIDRGGKLMGVIITFSDLDGLGKIVENRTGLGDTGEVLVAYRDAESGQVMNPFPRFFEKQGNYAQSTGESMRQALFGNSSIFQDTSDYRGVTVIAASEYIEIVDLGLVAKIDTSEVVGSYRTALIENLIIFGLIGLLISFIIGFILAYFISKPLDQLTEGAEIISEGDLGYKIDTKTKDEFGQVAEAFNKMSAKLKASYAGLEEKVRDRTKDLENATAASQNILEDFEVEKTLLALSNAKDEALLRGIGEGIVAVDSDGKIILINPAAEQMLGQSREQVVGKRILESWQVLDEKGNPVPEEKRPIAIALRGTTTTTTTTGPSYFYTKKNGDVFPVAITVTPVVINDKIIGAIDAFHDITKEKSLDKAKDEFISLASHQLKTPITAVSWNVESLLSGIYGEPNEKQKEVLERMHESGKNMEELVSGFLDVTKMESGGFVVEKGDVDLLQISDSVLEELASQISVKKINVVKRYGNDMPHLDIGTKTARVIFQNLITNAIKYTPESGTVEVNIDKTVNGVSIAVKDNGYGIAEKDKGKIFTKLFRADNIKEKEPSGTGLGLYLLKNLVEKIGGKVWFESKEGAGTTFYVTIG